MAKHDGSEFAWFLAGMALGIAGALLTAPEPGAETRRRLREKAEDARRVASERGRDLMSDAAESGRKAYERGRELYRKGRNLAEETADELTDAPTPQPIAESPSES